MRWVFLALSFVPAMALAREDVRMSGDNSFLVGMEAISYQSETGRKRLDSAYGVIALELYGPFRVTGKIWQVEPMKEIVHQENSLNQTTESYRGWFSGIEIVNTMSFLKVAFAVGYQSTLYETTQEKSADGFDSYAKTYGQDAGPALLSSIEFHLGGPVVAAINFGANHRLEADRTDAFAGAGLGLAY